MRTLVLALVLAAAAAPLHAQQRDRGGKGLFKPAPERRVTDGQRGDPRRTERMTPADRERLRRDIDEANRRMEPPRRR